MHPDDVAEIVAEEVEELRARVAAAPEIRADSVELIDRFELRIPFVKRELGRPHVLELAGRSPRGGGQACHRVLFNLGPLVERELILHCDAAGYDAQPITAELLLPDGRPLPRGEWPLEIGVGGLDALILPETGLAFPRVRAIRALGPQAIIQEHQDYDRPFFCRRGLREYHSHPQHENNPWDRHRESIRIYDIVPEILRDLQTRWSLQGRWEIQ